MQYSVFATSVCTLLALLGPPALAQPPTDTPVHDFHTLDRSTPVTTFGTSVGGRGDENQGVAVVGPGRPLRDRR
jgi:hypothetical protein